MGLLIDDKAYVISPTHHSSPDQAYPVTTEEIKALAALSLLPTPTTPVYDDEDFGTLYSIRHDSSPSMTASRPDDLYFFDPLDFQTDPIIRRGQGDREYGKPVFLTVQTGQHTDKFARDADIDTFLCQLTDEQLLGRGLDEKDPEYYIREATRFHERMQDPKILALQNRQQLTMMDEHFYDCKENHEDGTTNDTEYNDDDRNVAPAFKVEPKKTDYAAIRPYLGFQSIETIKKTIQNTTQMAKTILRFPLRCHVKARYPYLNRRRLNEKVSTDTVFSNHTDVTGYSCCQVFYGMASHMINVYGMNSKGEFPDIYRYFLQQEGAPIALRRDNAKEEKSWTVIDINRKNDTQDEFSQEYNQQQNPVEGHAIRWLKDHTKILMDRVGAPPDVWLQAFMYLADIHNISANDALRGNTPIAARHGNKPDISAFLQFYFWQKVLFRQEVSFPNSNERAGFFVGIAHNTGDKMTFKILDADTGEITSVTDLHAAEDRLNPNLRVRFGEPVIASPDETTDEATTDDPDAPTLEYSDEPFSSTIKPTIKPSRPKKRKDSLMPAMFQGRQLTHRQRRRSARMQRRKDERAQRRRQKSKNAPDAADPFTLSAPAYDPDPQKLKQGQKYPLGLTIMKPFNGQLYEGRITRYSPRERWYYVLYSDGDTEELDEREVAHFGVFPESTATDTTDAPPPTQDPTVPDVPSKDRGDNLNSDLAKDLEMDLEMDTSIPAAAAAHVDTTAYESPYKRHWRTNGITAMALAALTIPSCPIQTLPGQRIVESHPTVPCLTVPGHTDTSIEYKVNKLTTLEAQTLMYNQHIDMLQEQYNLNDDVTDEYFHVMAITQHVVLNRGKENEKVKLKAQLLDGTTQYYPMDVLRLQYPYIVADYVIRNHLFNVPHFQWTKDYAHGHDDLSRMIMHAKTVGRRPKLKFGVQVPQSVKQAYMLDRLNKDKRWEEATMKELKQIKDYETFRVLEEDEPMPDGYKRIPYHIVYDCKFDLRRKARLVAGGNLTDPPKEDTYSGVVGMETIRTVLMIAEMNKLDVCAADIGNAFLYGRTREKVYVIAGPEFGQDEGKRMIVEKGLYGLRSSGARFAETLNAKLRDMGFAPSKADECLWMRSQGDHWEYVATYVDDILAFSRNPGPIIQQLQKSFILKGVGEPEYFLGADIQVLNQEWQASDITKAMSSETYIQRMLEKFTAIEGGRDFPHAQIPMNSDCHPELDSTPFLNELDATKFRGMIGSCNWLITLGRFDINYAVNVLSRYSIQPREGHLKCLRQVIGYLAKYPRGKIVMDPTHMRRIVSATKSDEDYFEPWRHAYPDAIEATPSDLLPEPKGRSVNISCFVDADHARDQATRRSVSGMIAFLNSTPIAWMSKRQNTCETSTYGSEMVAARIATEKIMELRWNLRALGVPIDGPVMMYGDNQSVILSSTMPSSVLKKKHLACCYYRIREAIAAQILRFEYIKSSRNYADVLTKPLAKHEFHTLVKPILFRVGPAQRTDEAELVPTMETGKTSDNIPEIPEPTDGSKAPLSPFPVPLPNDPERPIIAAEAA